MTVRLLDLLLNERGTFIDNGPLYYGITDKHLWGWDGKSPVRCPSDVYAQVRMPMSGWPGEEGAQEALRKTFLLAATEAPRAGSFHELRELGTLSPNRQLLDHHNLQGLPDNCVLALPDAEMAGRVTGPTFGRWGFLLANPSRFILIGSSAIDDWATGLNAAFDVHNA